MSSRPLAVWGVVLLLGGLAWQVAPTWKQLFTASPVGGSRPSVSSNTTNEENTTNKNLFLGDRRKPYVMEWYADAPTGGVAWYLTVDDGGIQGIAYTSSSVFEAYGEATTSTEELRVNAYTSQGEPYAIVSGMWKENTLEAHMDLSTGKSDIRLLASSSEAARLSFERVEERWEDASRSLGCEFALRLPTVEVGGRVSRAVANRINQTIRARVLENVQTATQAQDRFLAACRTEVEQEYREWKDENVESGPIERAVSTELMPVFNYFPYLSFSVNSYAYTGGAHGSSGLEGLTFDLRSGEVVPFEALFETPSPRVLSHIHAEVAQRLVREYGDLLFPENLEQATRYHALSAAPSDEALLEAWNAGNTGFGTSTEFLLVPGGVRVVFQQYEIAPYSSGLPSVFIPLSVWRDEAAESVRQALSQNAL